MSNTASERPAADDKYIPEADDDSFDLLCGAIAEIVDAETYCAIMAKLEQLYEMRRASK